MSNVRLFALGAALALFAAPAAAQQEPPPPGPPADVEFPDFTEAELDNGARVLVVRNAEQPIVSVNLRVASGDADDPEGKAGVAEAVAELIDNGTATRTAAQIADAVDFIGATLGAGSGADWSSVTLTATTPHLEEGLALLADVVMNPSFPDDELEKERRRSLTALQVGLSDPGTLASRRFFAEVYGEHPYGWSPDPASVQAIGREDLVAFHDAHYRPDNALIVVAGDVEADDVVASLNRNFAGWTPGASPEAARPEPPSASKRVLHFVHKPGLVQAVMRVGHLMPPATEADWVGIDVAAQVLGGGTTGWLFRILRGEKGYTYGAYGGATERLQDGYFQATAEVRNEVADSALQELLYLIERLQTDVPAADLQMAQNFISGSFPLSIETPGQVAGQLATTLLLGRDVDYIEEYRGRAASYSPADVQQIAREYIHPQTATIVVVGDANEILDKVRPFADEVHLWTPEGETLAAEALAPPELSDLEVDLGALTPHTRVYAVSVQGNPFGDATITLERVDAAGREAFASRMALGPITQTTTFDAASFEPISYVAGGPATAELAYSDGRVTGSATVPNAGQSTVDMAVEPGTLLPGMDDYALALSDLSAGQLTLSMVDAGQGAVSPVTFTVEGEETITVPAGDIEVYRVSMTGGAAGGTLYLRKEFPHIVVKQEFAGQPIVLELKEIREP